MFFIDHSHVNIEWLAANAQTEKDHLNCWQQKLKQEQTAEEEKMVISKGSKWSWLALTYGIFLLNRVKFFQARTLVVDQ